MVECLKRARGGRSTAWTHCFFVSAVVFVFGLPSVRSDLGKQRWDGVLLIKTTISGPLEMVAVKASRSITTKANAAATMSPASTTATDATVQSWVVVEPRGSIRKRWRDVLQQESTAPAVSNAATSPLVSVDIRDPMTVDELASVVDLRLEVFAGTSFVSPTMKEKSTREMLDRRSKGARALVAVARRRPSPATQLGSGLSSRDFVYGLQQGAGAAAVTSPLPSHDANSVVVGSVEISTHEFSETGLSPGPNVPKLLVTELAVAEPFRRMGIASNLLAALDEEARRLGIPCMCLYVDAKNRAALSLYLRAGYKLVPVSSLATAFASALGLYSGPHAQRDLFFLYKMVSAPVALTDPTAWSKFEPGRRSLTI